MEESIYDIINGLNYEVDNLRERIYKLKNKVDDHTAKLEATQKSEQEWQARATKAENQLFNLAK